MNRLLYHQNEGQFYNLADDFIKCLHEIQYLYRIVTIILCAIFNKHRLIHFTIVLFITESFGMTF